MALMPDSALDLDRVAAGELPGVLLTAADLDAGLVLSVAIERAKGGLAWVVRVTGGPPRLPRTLRLGPEGLAALQAAVARAIEPGAARRWRIPARSPVLLADVGGAAVGAGVARGAVWCVVM